MNNQEEILTYEMIKNEKVEDILYLEICDLPKGHVLRSVDRIKSIKKEDRYFIDGITIGRNSKDYPVYLTFQYIIDEEKIKKDFSYRKKYMNDFAKALERAWVKRNQKWSKV